MENTPTITARRICKNTLIIRGTCIYIDRTYAARAWCIGKGMTLTARATDEDGAAYDIYTGVIQSYIGGTIDAGCAIPA